MGKRYLARRNRIYHFRIRLPADLVSVLGVGEYHRSLGTADLTKARTIARTYQAKTEVAFAAIRHHRLLYGSVDKETAVAVLCNSLPSLRGSGIGRGSSGASRAVRFSAAVETFIRDRQPNWEPKTVLLNRSALRLFQLVVGDKLLGEVARDDCRAFRDTLLRLPANMTKRFPGTAVDQVLALNVPPMSAKNAHRIAHTISSFFIWAVNEGLIGANPMRGMSIPLKSRADAERDAFNDADLKLLFERSPLYAGCLSERERHKAGPHIYRDAKFWLPLIGLYSGMRLEEIARLRVSDVRQEEGVWVFDVNGDGGKKLKTAHSVRVVPVHPELLRLGLLEHCKEVSENGRDRLWPDLRIGNDGFYSSPFSKWFGRFKRSIGIASPRLTFHSLRHTFINRLKQKGVPESKIRALVGHKEDSITLGRYGKRYEPAVMYETICLIDFGLSHLIH